VRRAHALDVPVVLGVAAGGIGLFAALVFLRFCGEVSVPDKPPRPRIDRSPERVSRELGKRAELYAQAVIGDARTAGVVAPSLDDMGKPITFRASTQRTTLRPGDAPVEIAGLELAAIKHRPPHGEVLLALQVENKSDQALVYLVDTELSGGSTQCDNRTVLEHDGNVIAPRSKILRSECGYASGMELYVRHVESAAINPLQAFYLSLVPPQALGADPRASQGHRASLPAGVTACNVSMPQSVRNALEEGTTRWRDLADFFARHPCTTFRFPEGYQSFEGPDRLVLPVVDE